MELVWTLLPVALLLYIFYAVFKAIKDYERYFLTLGAVNIKVLYFPFVSGDLVKGDLKARLWTSGVKGFFKLNLSVPVRTKGFLRLWRPGFCDGVLAHRTEDGFAIEYEDAQWMKDALKHWVLIRKLFEETNIHSFMIKNSQLILSWYIKRRPKEVSKENIHDALSILKELSVLLTNMPPSSDREYLRNWLTVKLPVFFTIYCVVLAVLGKFWLYKPLCTLDVFFVSFKGFILFLVSYLLFTVSLFGNKTLMGRMLLNTIFVTFVCYFFIALFFLTYINGSLDRSTPKLKRDTIVSKYIGRRWSKRVVLSDLHERKRLCEGFHVSQDFYDRVKPGDLVEYQVKEGFLGIEWMYSGLRSVKD